MKTLADLIADSIVKLKNDFVNKLKSLSLTNGTPISDVIRFCIDNERLDLIELIMLNPHGITTCILSPFEYALAMGKFNIADEMLKCGFDINSIGTCEFVGSGGAPPIIFAIRYFNENEPKALKFVLKHNPNLNIKYGLEKYTPLMFAINNEEYAFAELLLNAGTDLTIKSKEGLDVFDYCKDEEFKRRLLSEVRIKTIGDLVFREIKKGNNDLVKKIKYPHIDKSEPLDEFILKHVKYGDHEFIKQFMDDIKEIFKSEEKQHEIFMWCVRAETINLFLKHGFNIDSRSRGSANYTVLMTAVTMRSDQFIKLLINARVNIDLVSHCGNTALHIAIMNNGYDIVDMLLDANANVTIKNKNGHNALDMCHRHHPLTYKRSHWEDVKRRIEKILITGTKQQEIETVITKNLNKLAIPKTESNEQVKWQMEFVRTMESESITDLDESIDTYVNENRDMIKIHKILIGAYWNRKSAPEHVNFEICEINKNRTMSIKRLTDNGEWINSRIVFPPAYEYGIKLPQNVKPKFHVILPNNGIPIKSRVIIRFDDFEYA
jgi:ankyrin repeat protein